AAGAADDPALDGGIGATKPGLVDIQIGDAADPTEPAAQYADEVANDDHMVISGPGTTHEAQPRRDRGEAASGDVACYRAAADARALACELRPRPDNGADTLVMPAGTKRRIGFAPQLRR